LFHTTVLFRYWTQPDGLPVAPVGATTEDPDREADFSHIPFHDDSDAEEEGDPPGAATGGPRDDSLLQLSAANDTTGGMDTKRVSGLDESMDTSTTAGQKRVNTPPKRKRKKRRKVSPKPNSVKAMPTAKCKPHEEIWNTR
jgi:hypothetical protein